MSISAKLVMELRAKTGAGMMDCKKALIETNGDLQTAIDYLREKGISKAAKKASRIAAEGLVFISVSNNGKTGAMLELNSETDFVAKNEDFINFGNKLVAQILTNDISTVDELKNLEVDGSKINDQLTSLIATIGENMNIRRFRKAASESFVTTYIHMGGKIGVLLNMEGEINEENKTRAKDIAMHIAAMAPDFMDSTDVPEDVLEKEKAIVRAQLLEQEVLACPGRKIDVFRQELFWDFARRGAQLLVRGVDQTKIEYCRWPAQRLKIEMVQPGHDRP